MTRNTSYFIRVFLFALINFGALAIGGWFTGPGVTSEWYTNLNQAPWTPPGWVFGAAWTTIMICFSIYMAYLWEATKNKKGLILLYATQLSLNVLWNPFFFKFHAVTLGLITITLLTILILYFFNSYRIILKRGPYVILPYLILPYLVWLIIATSLNAYIFIYN